MTDGITNAIGGLLGVAIVADVAGRVITKSPAFRQTKARPMVRPMPRVMPRTHAKASRQPKWI